jgi:preprotein translocase subunit SecG
MGVRRTADFLEKATWTLAVLLFVFSVATSSPAGKKGTSGPSETSTTKDKAADFDKTAPANNTASPFGGAMQPQKPGAQTPPAATPKKP